VSRRENMCFREYEHAVVDKSTGYADNLDAALHLASCCWQTLKGSGPVYHPARGLTKSEQSAANNLAEKTKKVFGGSPSPHDISALADEAYGFAFSILIARGTVHSGPPKISLDKHE
jgi:hypothetical protein